MYEQIELGKKVKDKITGLEGIAVSKCIYLNSCIQYAIQAKIDKDGKIPDEKWIDEKQLEIIEQVVKKEASVSDYIPRRGSGGGFRNHPG